MLVLSLFPGIDLLGRAFELESYCVVRGPDLIFGGDIRDFAPPVGHFDGIIGGPPCQDFSSLRRAAQTGNGLAMLSEFVRCVEAATPDWFLMENVPGVPDIAPVGYQVQRFDLRANECGMTQQRLRHFQFGSASGEVLLLNRDERQAVTEKAATATEGTQIGRRGWAEFCVSQGLPADFDLPSFTLAARYQVVGNGVPIPMGRFIARAIRDARYPAALIRLCVCGCGRSIQGKQQAATPACRKRMERRRRDRALVAVSRRVTADCAASQEQRDMARSVGRCAVTEKAANLQGRIAQLSDETLDAIFDSLADMHERRNPGGWS